MLYYSLTLPKHYIYIYNRGIIKKFALISTQESKKKEHLKFILYSHLQ